MKFYNYLISSHYYNILVHNLSLFQVRLISMLCMGISFAIDPWCESYIGLLFLSFLCGIGIALYYPAMIRSTRNISNDRNTSIVFAYVFLIAAIGRLISGFTSGNSGFYPFVFLTSKVHRSFYSQMITPPLLCKVKQNLRLQHYFRKIFHSNFISFPFILATYSD